MKISVVIPAYNRLFLLKRAIESVIRQVDPVDEIIVVDNGSSDGTANMVRNQFPKVRYIFEPQAGVSKARNTGIRSSKCDWIALLDSDDEWVKKKLQIFKHCFEKSKTKELIWHSNEIWIRNGTRLNQKL